MSPKELLQEIFKDQTVFDEKGNKHTLTSNIDEKEGEFVYDLIKKFKPVNTIEIGCAMGISSLYICMALNEEEEKHHTIIDPMQSSDWANIGKANLDRAKIDFYELIEQPSEIALPDLLSKHKQYDLGFIDGWHTFDHTLIDFFYLNRLIKVGGIIIIDDISFPGIKKLMRYILNYPAYEIIGTANQDAVKGIKRYLYDYTIPGFFRCISKIFPPKMRFKLFAGNVLEPNKNKILNASMIAFRKVAEDKRRWDWFVDF
jgi:predicted O-methyltransferase YrrM